MNREELISKLEKAKQSLDQAVEYRNETVADLKELKGEGFSEADEDYKEITADLGRWDGKIDSRRKEVLNFEYQLKLIGSPEGYHTATNSHSDLEETQSEAPSGYPNMKNTSDDFDVKHKADSISPLNQRAECETNKIGLQKIKDTAIDTIHEFNKSQQRLEKEYHETREIETMSSNPIFKDVTVATRQIHGDCLKHLGNMIAEADKLMTTLSPTTEPDLSTLNSLSKALKICEDKLKLLRFNTPNKVSTHACSSALFSSQQVIQKESVNSDKKPSLVM